MTRLLLVEKGAGRATSGGGPDREAESEASAGGVLDQGFRVGAGPCDPEKVVGEARRDVAGMDHGYDSGEEGRRRPEAGAGTVESDVRG